MQSVWVFFSFFARQYLVGDPVFRYKTKTLQKGSDTKKQSVLITLFSMLLFCFYFKKNKNTHNLIFFSPLFYRWGASLRLNKSTEGGLGRSWDCYAACLYWMGRQAREISVMAVEVISFDLLELRDRRAAAWISAAKFRSNCTELSEVWVRLGAHLRTTTWAYDGPSPQHGHVWGQLASLWIILLII